VDWADPSGAVHGAGDFVDIDVVTLAELEERGVVENADEINRPAWVGPGKTEEEWVGPGDETESADDADAPDADQEES
jgi:hypothetical protein